MNRKNIVLLIVFIGIVSLIILNREGMKRQVEVDMEREQLKIFEDESPAINMISINNLEKNEVVTLENRGGTWFVKEKECIADESTVNRVVSALPNIRKGQLLGEWKPDFNREYGFDKGIEISAGGKSFILGDNRERRISLKIDNNLYLSPFNQKHLFIKLDGNWCKKVEEPAPENDLQENVPSES